MAQGCRRFVAGGLVVVGGMALVAAPKVAVAEIPVHHVYRTDGDGLIVHDNPGLHTTFVGLLADGDAFMPNCWVVSDDVSGNPIWLHGTSESLTGWVTDYYVDTHWNTKADLSAQGIPECGNTAEESRPSTQIHTIDSETHIQLRTDAGRREHNLSRLAARLDGAASNVGVDGQTLARVIYHEGGNYLDTGWRRSLAEQKEMQVTSTVGVAQVKISTARLVDLLVYKDWELVNEPDDMVIRSKLIFDWDYSFRSAAGYLKLLQDEGIEGRYAQFMSYCLSIEGARAWKEAGYSMDHAALEEIGIDPEVMERRQQELNEAKAAIG